MLKIDQLREQNKQQADVIQKQTVHIAELKNELDRCVAKRNEYQQRLERLCKVHIEQHPHQPHVLRMEMWISKFLLDAYRGDRTDIYDETRIQMLEQLFKHETP